MPANRCEDYPCCGHGPAPLGDGGGCPDEQGRFDCVLCGSTMPRGHHSAICSKCRTGKLKGFGDDFTDPFEDDFNGPY